MMMSIERILCPVDFSEFSQRALDHAGTIARWYGAKVLALHVFAVPPGLEKIFPHARGGILDGDGRGEILNDLQALAAPLRERDVPVDLVLREGDVASRIRELAEAAAADLIVVGTHGRRGYERWLLGSVTERILRVAACPVLTVPRAATSPAASPADWTTILCPVDFSPASLAAVDYALSFAQQVNARLVLLHVVEWFLDQAALAGASPELARYHRVLHDEALERLEALIPAAARDWCRAEALVAHGRPYERVLEAASDQAASLIVMGAQGRAGVRLAFFGSTTQHVIRGAVCPVLSVRGPRAASRSAAA